MVAQGQLLCTVMLTIPSHDRWDFAVGICFQDCPSTDIFLKLYKLKIRKLEELLVAGDRRAQAKVVLQTEAKMKYPNTV